MQIETRAGTRLTCGAVALLLTASLVCAQEVATEPLPLTEPTSREEIMASVSGIQDEIDALPEDARSETNPRYLELRSELQLLLLQAELERLRVENETLQELVDGAASPGSDAPAASLPLIQQRLTELQASQASFNEQLQVISEQHAQILGGAEAAPSMADHSMTMGGGQTHVIQEGESLSYIAEQVYGTANRWPDIFEANPMITDPNNLEVGTQLTIP